MNAVATLTFVHVIICLVGLASGFVVLWGFLTRQRLDRWTALFLSTTIATSATGFLFPVDHVTPGHVLGVISLVLLAIAVAARYGRQMAGGWRPAYVVSAVAAQYLNFFVLVVQLFLKVPALKALAPTQTEPAFAVTQFITLAAFVALGAVAVRRFRGEIATTSPNLTTLGPMGPAPVADPIRWSDNVRSVAVTALASDRHTAADSGGTTHCDRSTTAFRSPTTAHPPIRTNNATMR